MQAKCEDGAVILRDAEGVARRGELLPTQADGNGDPATAFSKAARKKQSLPRREALHRATLNPAIRLLRNEREQHPQPQPAPTQAIKPSSSAASTRSFHAFACAVSAGRRSARRW